MQRKLTRLIRHKATNYGDKLVDSRGNTRDATFMRKGGFHVPRSPYRVTFSLDPAGPLVVRYGAIERVRLDGSTLYGYRVCFLPPKWDGKRRTVRPL